MSYAPFRPDPALIPTEAATDAGAALLDRPSPARRRATGRSRRPARRSLKHPKSRQPARDFPIIVHCHLGWDWVWQRPQQFLSRLSQTHKILFVELIGPDKHLAVPTARYRSLETLPNITVLQLQFPEYRWNDPEYVDAERRRMVQEFVVSGPVAGQFDRPVQWFYDPMAVTAFAGHMGEVATVYDCMDELSKFRGAPPQIVARERELLARADVVFTGGRRLFESKSRHHSNCHFYGCGVDARHFGKARLAETAVPADIAALGKPVLGYFGVVDERMDYDLVARLAEANPKWSVAMVGPVIKVDPAVFPRRPNLHWLGGRPYADLPAVCKAFDVCLMPFALNESTEFINPTKALEYMATGRPIVSTAVPDVVRNFGEAVHIAESPQHFIEQCRHALQAPDRERIARGHAMAADHSWESIVEQLEQHIVHVLEAKHATV